jgi:hypothetical protein
MPRISLSSLCLALAAGAVLTVACGNDVNLPPATVENTVDTAEVFALRGTAIGTPSAFDVASALPVLPELGDPFDFAFDIDSTGAAIFYPSGLLGGSTTAGIHRASDTFDEIRRAPLEDYVTDSIVAIATGMVLVVRSRAVSAGCSAVTGALPRYGKFEVLSIDAGSRTVTLKMLVDLNCGYRELVPGVPTS